MLDTLPRPAGKVRGYRVSYALEDGRVKRTVIKTGRSMGKSTAHGLSGLTLPTGPIAHFPFYSVPRPPFGWTPATAWKHNDVLYDWATIVGKLLLKQGTQYGIGGMYVEYQNVADPDAAVAAPTIDRQDGIDYYNSLAGSGDTDYLRVPLVAGTLGSTDPDVFPGGNSLTFFAQTTGVTGVHGLPFSDAANSKAYGGALVAFVDRDDATRDLVFSRFYFDPSDQLVKLASGQIGYEWVLNLN